jgi:hypothetical protein
MSEIRGGLKNVLRFPRALPCVSHVWQTTQWIHASIGGLPGVPNAWRLIEDTDRSLLLIPIGGPEPGFVITATGGEYEVMICAPDDIDELGPFRSLEEALAGITSWLTLPTTELEADEPQMQRPDPFRPSFAVPRPQDLFFEPYVEN